MADEMAQNHLRELLAEFEGRLNQRFDQIDERIQPRGSAPRQVSATGSTPLRRLSRPWTRGYPLELRS